MLRGSIKRKNYIFYVLCIIFLMTNSSVFAKESSTVEITTGARANYNKVEAKQPSTLCMTSSLIQNKYLKNDAEAMTKTSSKDSTERKIKESGVINIACFGLDGGTLKTNSRSDTIMVLSVDTKKSKLKLTSLMRDMYVTIPGKGKNKINAAYALGGPKLAISTINTNFSLGIKDYIAIDFKGMEKLVDYLGGVTVCLNSEEAKRLSEYIPDASKGDDKKYVKLVKGNVKLNGKLAVEYCRIRMIGNGDYERTSRQRRVLEQLLQKIKSNGLLKLPKTVSTIMPYIKTSLSYGNIITLTTKVLSLKSVAIEQLRLPIEGSYKTGNINKMWVIIPDLDSNKKKLISFIYNI